MKDCTAKNGHVNASTMKDVVDACCNAKREENIDGNMKAAATVGNVLSRVPVLLTGTSKSDMGINATIDTAATDILQMKGKMQFNRYFEEQL